MESSSHILITVESPTKKIPNTSSCVRLNGQLSDNFSTAFGTRQGDPISPTNFSIFINDLLVELRNEKLDSDVLISNVYAYADDLVIVSESEMDLQRLINIVRSWCNRWRLTLNIDKTKIVHYRKENAPCTEYIFTSALIVLSHNDRGVRALIMRCPLYSNAMYLSCFSICVVANDLKEMKSTGGHALLNS